MEETRWYLTDQDGNIVPKDPITGDQLLSDRPPESLLAEDRLAVGYEFLQRNATRIRLGLLLGAHNLKSDLVTAGMDMHKEVLELKGGILYVEGVDSDIQARTENSETLNYFAGLNAGQTAQLLAKLAESPEVLASFYGERVRQIAGTGVEIVFPDYLKTGGGAADDALAQWQSDLEKLSDDPQDTAAVDRWWATNLGFTIYRDWYLIGKVGADLAERYPDGLMDDISIKLQAGSNHRNIGRAFEDVGAKVSYAGDGDPLSDMQVIMAADGLLVPEHRIISPDSQQNNTTNGV